MKSLLAVGNYADECSNSGWHMHRQDFCPVYGAKNCQPPTCYRFTHGQCSTVLSTGATTMKDVSPHGDEIISPERQHLNEHSTNNPAGSRHQEPSAPIECDHSSSSDLGSPILEWVYGYDSGIQNGVHSLGRSNGGRKAVFFPASNTGVVHFYADEGGDPTRFASQVLLRGHTNRISAVAVSQDRKWIATGDIGKIAESEDIPSKSACQASGYRDSSPGILATATSDMYQGVAIWNWKEFGNAPLRMAVIAIPDIQHEIRFNQWDVNELLTSGRRRILFWYWHWDDVSFHFYSPALQSKTFQQKVGDITTSVFIPQSTKALSGTTDGDVVVWNLSLILDGLSRPDERRAVSILKLRNACVTCLKTFQARWIVSGFSDGAVCFYDPQLRLVRCFEDLNAVRCLLLARCLGYLKLWNTESHTMLSSICFDKLSPTAAAFSPSGRYLAIGFSNGTLKICELRNSESLDPLATTVGEWGNLVELIGVRESRDGVTHVSHLPNAPFHFDHRMGNSQLPEEWAFAGLMQRQSCIIEQRAIPSGCLALPSPVGNTDTEVLVYSSDAKAKIWSANSMSCVKTASAAMGHNGILQLAVMQEWTEAESPATFSPILIGACKEQLLGVYQLPLDGDPFKNFNVAAHAGPIIALAASAPHAGCTSVFTCGGSDLTIFLLIAHFLHVHAPTGPSGTASIVERLPGGVTGDLYRIAKEFFYYAQLRSQGEHTTRRRRLGEDVPIEEIPNLLCALGEAPTLLELGNVMSECRGASGVLHRQRAEGQIGAAHDTPSKSHSVAFERFLELYLNQRASKAFHHSDIIDAFKQLSKGSDTNEISPEELTRLLLTKGEVMTEAELSHCLEVLTGEASLASLCKRSSITADLFTSRVLQMDTTFNKSSSRWTS
ncbi:cilia- and flagella-associated protein 251 [Cyclospora cayetanensis]|uniref:Cilia- and flagella-associated protein 251 n=1 Tax=Cyclospora cayetanensis TaxID=88456 RepID=A0A6P6RTP8_9EIME|nr:cilia- and flagella-associated protein 251 [Cyclospora cayetanensis]